MQRGRAGIAQDHMLAHGGMMVIDAVNHTDFQSQFLVAQADGKRLSVGQSGLVRAYQVERRIGSRAQPSVAQERKFRGHVHVDLPRHN